MPTPSDAAVVSFAELAKKELGLDLDYRQAREAATQVLHMHFLKEHCAAALRPEIAEEVGADAAAPTPEAADEPEVSATPAEPAQLAPAKRGRPCTKPVVEFRPLRPD